jgi:sorbitol/mannitol transport system permease protein
VLEQRDYPKFAMNSIILAGGSTLLALVIAVPAAWGMAFSPTKRTKDLLPVDAVDQDDAGGRRAGADVPELHLARAARHAFRHDHRAVPRQPADRDLDAVHLFQGDPKDILEAARMDGATTWKEILFVLTPMAIPGIASTVCST